MDIGKVLRGFFNQLAFSDEHALRLMLSHLSQLQGMPITFYFEGREIESVDVRGNVPQVGQTIFIKEYIDPKYKLSDHVWVVKEVAYAIQPKHQSREDLLQNGVEYSGYRAEVMLVKKNES